MRDIFRYRSLLKEGKDKKSEFNRLFKVYGKNLGMAFCVDEIFLFANVFPQLNSMCPDSEEGKYASSYLEWVVQNCIKQGEEAQAKLLDVSKALRTFDALKRANQLSANGIDQNIQSYDFDSLVAKMSSVGNLSKQLNPLYRKIQALNGQCKEVYNDGSHCIYAVYTWEANRLLGANTRWCTVANYTYYRHYKGAYYIILDLDSDGAPLLNSDRVQFHFVTYDENYDYDDDDEGSLYACDVDDTFIDWDEIKERFGISVMEAVESLWNDEDYFDDMRRSDSWNKQQASIDYYWKTVVKYCSSQYGVNINEIIETILQGTGMSIQSRKLWYEDDNRSVDIDLDLGRDIHLDIEVLYEDNYDAPSVLIKGESLNDASASKTDYEEYVHHLITRITLQKNQQDFMSNIWMKTYPKFLDVFVSKGGDPHDIDYFISSNRNSVYLTPEGKSLGVGLYLHFDDALGDKGLWSVSFKGNYLINTESDEEWMSCAADKLLDLLGK